MGKCNIYALADLGCLLKLKGHLKNGHLDYLVTGSRKTSITVHCWTHVDFRGFIKFIFIFSGMHEGIGAMIAE